MNKFLLMLMLVSSAMFAQDTPKQGHFNLGFGKANMFSHKTLDTSVTDFVQLGVQLDAVKGKFVFGPETRLMLGVDSFPQVTAGWMTGYDNDKFRLVTTVGMIGSTEQSLFKGNFDVFQGIGGVEVGYSHLFIRADWYTNLHTYFYSYAVQAGFKIKF